MADSDHEEMSSSEEDNISYDVDCLRLLTNSKTSSDDNDVPSSSSMNLFNKKRLHPARLKQKRANHEDDESLNTSSSKFKPFWEKLINKTSKLEDPWEAKPVASMATEEVKRYRFDLLKQSWIEDRVFIKIETEAFDRGAMRECFRLKKLSTKQSNDNWNCRSNNFVAKRYHSVIDRSVYFEDVRLQMDAKLWANHFNKQKQIRRKVDIIQMAVIEFVNSAGTPLYHIESFFSGEYIKYNSNAGFVEVFGGCRNTPNAFSHFTFEHSGHCLIVVDIQGVGDLYTDPQIHTASGKDYGDGNLGSRGMALFFHSHKCNKICDVLELSKFEISNDEFNEIESFHSSNNASAIRSETEAIICNPDHVRNINYSPGNRSCVVDGASVIDNLNDQRLHSQNDSSEVFVSDSSGQDSSLAPSESRESQCSENNDSASFSDNKHISDIFKRRRSNFIVNNEDFCAIMKDTKILSKIHHDMALLHVSGRFLRNKAVEQVNWSSVYFHEKLAADYGFRDALQNMYIMHLGFTSDLFYDGANNEDKSVSKGCFEADVGVAISYLEQAIELSDRVAMILLASMLDRSAEFILSIDESKLPTEDWGFAIYLYEKAIKQYKKSSSNETCFSGVSHLTYVYEIKARMAYMYANGGSNLEVDTVRAYDLYYEAADDAVAHMKGKLANSYYEAAEKLD